MTQESIGRINKLGREQLIEAAGFVCRSLVGDEVVDETAPALQAIAEQPYRHLPDVESMSRLILISVASTPEGEKEVRDAIAGVGRRQFVLGGTEIVALAALGVVALKIIVTRGRGKINRTITYFDDHGKAYAKVEEVEEPVSITSELSTILRSYFGLNGKLES